LGVLALISMLSGTREWMHGLVLLTLGNSRVNHPSCRTTHFCKYHLNMNRAHSENELVSDPTMGSTPVGVDFYRIGNETGDQYGPFGVLYPIQDPPGRHPFRCDGVTKATLPASCKNQSMP